MKSPFVILILALITSLSACNNQVKEERLARIDSLGVHLNHVNEVLANVDSVALQNWAAEISRNEKWIWDNVDDTLDSKPGIIVGDYFRTKKYASKVLSRYSQVAQESKYAKTQLATLREDIKNSFYSDEEFSGYFNTESEAMAKLVNASDELENGNKNIRERYQLIKPKFDTILDSIKNIIYSNEPVS